MSTTLINTVSITNMSDYSMSNVQNYNTVNLIIM